MNFNLIVSMQFSFNGDFQKLSILSVYRNSFSYYVMDMLSEELDAAAVGK